MSRSTKATEFKSIFHNNTTIDYSFGRVYSRLWHLQILQFKNIGAKQLCWCIKCGTNNFTLQILICEIKCFKMSKYCPTNWNFEWAADMREKWASDQCSVILASIAILVYCNYSALIVHFSNWNLYLKVTNLHSTHCFTQN